MTKENEGGVGEGGSGTPREEKRSRRRGRKEIRIQDKKRMIYSVRIKRERRIGRSRLKMMRRRGKWGKLDKNV